MATMYPKSLNEYSPTQSEKIVYEELKKQLPDTWEVFYSITWSRMQGSRQEKSEADFMVLAPGKGFIVLEVKGGSSIRIENNIWYVGDETYGERKLNSSPYEQADKSMYYFKDLYSNVYHSLYNGIYASCAVFPFHTTSQIVGLSERQEELTIDIEGLKNLKSRLTEIFRVLAGPRFGKINFSIQEYRLLIQLVKKRIAISAAAGALIKYKEQQLSVINRVQDNYIYMLSNLRQFYIRGGAGTGKTWLALKLGVKYAQEGEKTLLVCASKPLSEWMKQIIGMDAVDVMTYEECLEKVLGNDFNKLSKPEFKGAYEMLPKNMEAFQYDAIIIDEAQDFNEEWAYVIKMHLRDERNSHLVVLYDEVQNLNTLLENNIQDTERLLIDNVFMIDIPPLLLRENIRNTASIYSWATEKTKLGQEVIVNPVEGPQPKKEKIRDMSHLIQRLEKMLKEFIIDEKLESKSVVILVDELEHYEIIKRGVIATWRFVSRVPLDNDEIQVSDVGSFKGLEADMVIYIHSENVPDNINYIAYTRAKYYLYEMIL